MYSRRRGMLGFVIVCVAWVPTIVIGSKNDKLSLGALSEIAKEAPEKTFDEHDGFWRGRVKNCQGRWGYKSGEGEEQNIFYYQPVRPPKIPDEDQCKAIAEDRKKETPEFFSVAPQGWALWNDAYKSTPQLFKNRPTKACDSGEESRLDLYMSTVPYFVLVPKEELIQQDTHIDVPEWVRKTGDVQHCRGLTEELGCRLTKNMILVKGTGDKDEFAPQPLEQFAQNYVECSDRRNELARIGLTTMQFRDALVVALLEIIGLGCCGIDRCYMGQVCCGVAKCATFGGLLFWAIIDAVIIYINLIEDTPCIKSMGFQANWTPPSRSAGRVASYIGVVVLVLHFGWSCVGKRVYDKWRAKKSESMLDPSEIELPEGSASQRESPPAFGPNM